MRTLRTLHPEQILHAPGANSVHGGVLPGEPRAQGLQSGAECFADRGTADP